MVPPILRNRARLSNRSSRIRTGNHAPPRLNPSPGPLGHGNQTCRGRGSARRNDRSLYADQLCRAGPGFLKWPPILGLFKSVAATLAYVRHNRTQAEIGESVDVSQPTISRTIKVITPLIAEGLAGYVPTANELDTGTQYIVDGTLLHC